MAPRPPPAAVQLAQYQIFNKLCTLYMRGKDLAFLRAEDVRKELEIPECTFVEALRVIREDDPSVVEVIESEGDTYIRLGESSRCNCDDIDN